MVQVSTGSTRDGARVDDSLIAPSAPAAAGARLPARWFVLLVILGAASCLLCAVRFGAHVGYEMAQYAEIARNLAEGRGFVTQIALPSSLATYVGEGSAPPWPVVDRFFGLPLLASVLVRLTIDPVAAILCVEAISAGLLLASTGAAAFSLGGRRAALFSTGVLLINPLVVHRWAGGGLVDLPFAALVGTLVYVLAMLPAVLRTWCMAGALGGAALIVRYNFAIWLPFCFAWVAWRSPGARLRSVGCALLGAVLVVGPTLAATMLNDARLPRYLVGTWNLVADIATPLEPWRLFRVWHAQDALDVGLFAIAAKGGRNLVALLADSWDLFCAPLAVGLALVGATRSPTRSVVLVTLGLLVPQVLLIVLTRSEVGVESVWKDRYLAWLVAPLFALAGAGIAQVKGTLGTALAVVVGSVTAWGYAPYFGALPHLDAQNHFARETLETLQANSPQSITMSNVAYSIALSYRLPAVDFPADDASVTAILKAAPVDVIVIDTEVALATLPASVRRELDGDGLVGFCARHGFSTPLEFFTPDGALRGLVLRRQPASGR